MGQGATYTYILVITGAMALFYFTGLSTEAGTILSALLAPENFTSSEFWTKTIIALSTGLVGSIVIGIFTKNIELSFMAPVTLFLATALADFTKIFILLASLNVVLAILFMGPFFILIPFALIDYWRGVL